MAPEIRWSENAIKDYKNVVDYLLMDWNEDIALKFIELLAHKIQQVLKHPYTGVASSEDSFVRSFQ
jgi:plasmid stabilization system protein ParE